MFSGAAELTSLRFVFPAEPQSYIRFVSMLRQGHGSLRFASGLQFTSLRFVRRCRGAHFASQRNYGGNSLPQQHVCIEVNLFRRKPRILKCVGIFRHVIRDSCSLGGYRMGSGHCWDRDSCSLRWRYEHPICCLGLNLDASSVAGLTRSSLAAMRSCLCMSGEHEDGE